VTHAVSVARVNPNAWLRECALPFQQGAFATYINFTNYNLSWQSSGLCADHLSCAFVNCEWNSDAQQV
jgi:hypothetical protein